MTTEQLRALVIEKIDAQIASYERALPPGKSITVDADTLCGSWRKLRAQVEAA